jgi:Cohesin domain/PEP-CTERM motif
MRQPRLFSALFVCVFVVGLSLCAPTAEAAPILSVNPGTTTIGAGDTFSLQIDIADAVDLYAYQFSLVFDPAILSVTSVVEGGFFGFSGIFFPGFVDNTLGIVSFIANVNGGLSGVSGSGTLADLQFSAVAPGVSSISLLFDAAAGDGLYDSNIGLIDFSSVGGSVGVTDAPQVPEPASLVLLGSGLAGAWYRHRRKRAA